MTKEEQYEIYCNVLNGNMSEEEMLYHKLKADDKGMVDLGLLMKRNKEKYPSLVTNIDQITSNTLHYIVYYNSYNKKHVMSSLVCLIYNNEYNIFDGSIDFYDEVKRVVFDVSKDIAYFTDEEDANKLLLHLIEKTQGDNNV